MLKIICVIKSNAIMGTIATDDNSSSLSILIKTTGSKEQLNYLWFSFAAGHLGATAPFQKLFTI